MQISNENCNSTRRNRIPILMICKSSLKDPPPHYSFHCSTYMSGLIKMEHILYSDKLLGLLVLVLIQILVNIKVSYFTVNMYL